MSSHFSYVSTDNWVRDGDCIGLGKQHGTPASYIQSDVQFAQEVQKVMRFSAMRKPNGPLPDSVNMNIFAHFFVH